MSYKILYFAFVSDNYDGVEQKIIAQFDALSALGADAHLFLISKFAPGEALSYEIAKRKGVDILINASENFKNPWGRRKEKFELISLTLQKFNPGDTIVYIRYPLADFLFLKFLRKNKVYKFVTEHQDIENTSIKGWMKVFEILWGKPVRRMITGFVGVTSEITDYERSYIKAENHHFITIGNGIDIQKYPLRVPTKERQNNEIRMLFVGGGHKHHGLARLIWSIYLYYKNINPILDVQLKIVGDSLEMVNSKNLVEKLKLTSRIKFLGNIKNENLNEIFNWADVGVASLGLHKIGLSKSSTLKTKEYFIRGLPFFWSSADDDFPNKYPYILQLKSEDSPFDLFQVISFVEKIKSKVNHPLEMRQYAIDNLDWSIKMKKLISFFDEILETNHK